MTDEEEKELVAALKEEYHKTISSAEAMPDGAAQIKRAPSTASLSHTDSDELDLKLPSKLLLFSFFCFHACRRIWT